MKNKIFISYNHSDASTARSVAERLSSMGLHVWLDENEIDLGEPISKSISEALHNSSHVIVLITPKDKESDWVKKEVELAREQHKRIIPILADHAKPSDLPDVLADRLAVNISDNIDNLESVYRTIDADRSAWNKLREWLIND